MVRIELPYGKDGSLGVNLPERNFAGTIRPLDVPVYDEMGEIDRALDDPVGHEDIETFLKGAKDVVFIVNDQTRPTPTAKVLEALARRLDLKKYRYLIATGTHRAPDEDELRFIFGAQLDQVRHRIHVHDCRKDRFVPLGRSKNGTEMEVNEMAVKADRLVMITSVEPHYFAGYTGGRKSFLPGVASFKCIEQNHRLAMRQESRSLALEGNPVHEDMVDALQEVKEKKIFSIQVVMDRHQNVYRTAAGDLFGAFDQAVEWANEVFVVDVPAQADMVITVAPYPMDIDLYQSQKAIDNAKGVMKEGGVILLVSKCRCGVGEPTFCEQLAYSSDPIKVLENLECKYALGYHKAAKLAEIMTKGEIWAVTDLDHEMIHRINMRPFHTAQEAVDTFLANVPNAKILVMMDGSVTVPRVG